MSAGNLERAVELGDDALEAAFDAGNPQATAWVRYPAGLAHAHRGDDDRRPATARPSCGRGAPITTSRRGR